VVSLWLFVVRTWWVDVCLTELKHRTGVGGLFSGLTILGGRF
jgi:hypothetical protein